MHILIYIYRVLLRGFERPSQRHLSRGFRQRDSNEPVPFIRSGWRESHSTEEINVTPIYEWQRGPGGHFEQQLRTKDWIEVSRSITKVSDNHYGIDDISWLR